MLLRSRSNTNSWLLSFYCKNILHPFASSVIEELIEHHWLPLRNDYDLLAHLQSNDQLSITDISFVYGGHLHHTKYDHHKLIPTATFQRTSNNLLNFIRALANTPELLQKHVRTTTTEMRR